MTGIYLLAGRRTELISLYGEVHCLCAAYRTDGLPELVVRTTQEDILAERRRSPDAQNAPDSYLETLAVYRKLAEGMVGFRTLLVHGSAIGTEGGAYLFAAKSGTGKSTHTRLWREMLGDTAVMLNDDKPLLTIGESGTVVHGTPWDGKHHLSTPLSLPLRGLCFLERGAENCIAPLAVSEAFPLLAAQTYRPADRNAMAQTLDLLEQLVLHTPLYRMQCNTMPEAAAISYRMMVKG